MKRDEQKPRILAAARRAGDRGVCAADFSGAYGGCVDGKEPIPRFAARVMELREDGYRLEGNGQKRNGTKVFVLVAEAEPAPEPVMTHEHFEALSLAALAPAPRSAIYDEDNGEAA